ncbi:diguanylate cyclase/phosphodiesterase [Saccharopolyspora erythraea NRRL 2338]|uniref:GGDEF domain-containing protein n=1 Tax=Saccharopolyspora erythraea TaxID=1836 RepID=A0ABN1CM22_SACER|nr:GGDEF domain-containing protein [Saccharopolyspora erythraea]EQD87527.1 diguanylate cyclase [Saccharopolyspora erythraea D]PFG95267.1 diguanylate cyclase/phosphodiesterase [Saccharopolyspora erythraea NRRL 2338]QRK91917.1 GGDEF domain-containing protein [Saccharopolyspora erythraea]
MSTGNIDSVLALVDEVRFAFQPLINVKTGAIVAVEALARPAGAHVHDLFREAARQRRLTELDVQLAVAALKSASEFETLLPLHLNVFGGTVAHDLARLDVLGEDLRRVGRRPQELTIEIGPPFARLDPAQLVAGVEKLRADGYQVALDGVGEGDVPLTLIADMRPSMVKLDRGVVQGLPDTQARLPVLEAVRHLCEATESLLVAEGVENERQLTALRRNGVRLVQGNLLAPAARRPPTVLTIPGVAAEITDPHAPSVTTLAAGPRVTEFLAPATTLPTDVTADQVRQVLADHPEISGVVLVDEQNHPHWTIDRNRFLLAVTGPYGHALHARRPASRLADEPRVVTTATTAMEALGLITGSDQYRMYDDAIVVDESGRCLGIVRAGQLIRGMADLKVEEAAALNPLTRLPGSDAIARDVARRLAADEVFAVSWLDIDGFKTVNDTAGFSAGDDLIRSIGRTLTDSAAGMSSVQVGHVGGDDFLIVSDLDDLVPLSEILLDPPRTAGGVDVSLSLATFVCARGTATTYDEVSRQLAPLKRHAKSLHGSSWVMSRPGSDRIDVLRGTPTAPEFPAQDFPAPHFPTHEPDARPTGGFPPPPQ